jgi:hypothetical protein
MYLVVCKFKSSYIGSSSLAKEPHNIKLSQIVMQLEMVFYNPNPLLYPVLIKQRIPPSHCLDVLDKIFQL